MNITDEISKQEKKAEGRRVELSESLFGSGCWVEIGTTRSPKFKTKYARLENLTRREHRIGAKKELPEKILKEVLFRSMWGTCVFNFGGFYYTDEEGAEKELEANEKNFLELCEVWTFSDALLALLGEEDEVYDRIMEDEEGNS